MPSVANFESGLLHGLCNYFGGKRKLVRLISKLAVGKSFCDLFFGGGSVGLYLKAQGFRVEACDRSYLSQVTGVALLQNDFKRVTRQDLQRLFMPQDANNFCTLNFYPDLFTARHSTWIDDAVAAAEKVRDETQRALAKLVIAKAIFHLRAFGAFTNKLYMRQWNGHDESGILKRSGTYFKNLALTTWELASRAAEEVNDSVFANGEINRFYAADVFSYLDQGRPIDTIYLDPPYFGSQDYERYYGSVNKILTRGEWNQPQASDFNSEARWFGSMERLIQKCSRIPRLILSYGGYEGEAEIERIQELLVRVRGQKIENVRIPYSYSIHRTQGNGADAPEVLLVSDL